MLKNIDQRYLAVLVILSLGVLSGCDYCTPILIASLILPVTNYLADRASSSNATTHSEGVES